MKYKWHKHSFGSGIWTDTGCSIYGGPSRVYIEKHQVFHHWHVMRREFWEDWTDGKVTFYAERFKTMREAKAFIEGGAK